VLTCLNTMFSGLTNYCLNEVFTVMQDDFSQFHKVLGHPVRRKIIQLLGDDGGASFVKLKSFLNVSVGTIYYNLGLLEGFVSQRNDRRYVLTKKGVLVYRLLQESEGKVMLSSHVDKGKDFKGLVFQWLVKSSLLPYLFPVSKLSFLPALGILVYGVWVTRQAELYPIVFFYVGGSVASSFSGFGFFLFGFFLVNVVGYLVPRLLFGRRGRCFVVICGDQCSLVAYDDSSHNLGICRKLRITVECSLCSTRDFFVDGVFSFFVNVGCHFG
jgi:hypothetical protein